MAQIWAKGKALETIIALGEISPGDELVFDVCSEVTVSGRSTYRHAHEDEGKYAGKVAVVDDIDEHPGYPINVTMKGSGDNWSVCYCSIKAWRRPI